MLKIDSGAAGSTEHTLETGESQPMGLANSNPLSNLPPTSVHGGTASSQPAVAEVIPEFTHQPGEPQKTGSLDISPLSDLPSTDAPAATIGPAQNNATVNELPGRKIEIVKEISEVEAMGDISCGAEEGGVGSPEWELQRRGGRDFGTLVGEVVVN